jgi:membrane fusion protein, copper/silver efflux system
MLKNILSRFHVRNALSTLLILLVGVLLGWLLFAGSGKDTTRQHDTDTETIWTCSMHPNIRQPEPGLCPICAMDLIPLDADGSSDDQTLYVMTEEAMAAADVRTTIVGKGFPFRELRLSGRVDVDETRQAEITARVAGRIEHLYVNTTGQQVQAGARLASIYSPELLAAQKELLQAAKIRESNAVYYEAARNKLRYWDFTDAQIDDIVQRGQVNPVMDILTPRGGVVLQRHVAVGDYVRQGQGMFTVADLSRVWVQFDAYESDVPWLRKGMPVTFSVAGDRANTYSGIIAFIDPVIHPQTRVARVRVEASNASGALKPSMFASAVIKSMIDRKSENLLVPKSAVLWTGTRSVVWVKDGESEHPAFLYREVTLGEEASDSYIVLAGLVAGEEVVTNAAFTVDAAAQLQGKASMMNPPARTREDETTRLDGLAEIERLRASGTFRVQLRQLYEEYERIRDALVAADASAVSPAARSMRTALSGMDISTLSEAHRLEWVQRAQTLRSSIDALATNRNIEKQREHFSALSNTLYAVVKRFGINGASLYWQHCPMAFNDAGASWLSSIKEIRNPYFGDKMLKCGVVQEEIGGGE